MATVLVTGGSGFVGSHALPELIDGGHRVVALVRGKASGDRILRRLDPTRRAAVELRTGDVTAPATLPAAFDGVDAVVHLVAIARDRNAGEDLRRVNTEGTRNVVAAAREAGVRRFVHEGALGVADEPSLHYASSKARAERIVAESGLDWTILAPSLMWGPRDGFFNIVADLVRVSPGIVPVPGRGTARFQPFAVADMVRVLRLVLERPATIGRTFPLGGPRYWTYRQITEEVLRAMGRRRIVEPMPIPLISLVAATAESVGIPFPVATDQLRQLRLDNVGPLDAVRDAFGFEPEDMAGRLGYLRRRRRDQEPGA